MWAVSYSPGVRTSTRRIWGCAAMSWARSAGASTSGSVGIGIALSEGGVAPVYELLINYIVIYPACQRRYREPTIAPDMPSCHRVNPSHLRHAIPRRDVPGVPDS